MERLSYYFRKIVLFLLLVFNGIILYYAFFTLPGRSKYLASAIARPQYMLIIGVLLISGLIYVVFSYLEHCKESYYKIICATLLLTLGIGQLIIIFAFDITQITDAFIVKDQALAIVQGVEQHFNYEDTWYFRRYGNNNFIVILFMWMYKVFRAFHITNDTIPFAIINALLIDVGLFFVFLTLKRLRREKEGLKFLVLCVISPISYFAVWWIYSCTFSVPIGTALIYLAVRMYQERTKISKVMLYSVIVGVLLTLGYLLRPTAWIPFIAVLCCMMFLCKKGELPWKNIGIGAVCLVIAMSGSFLLLDRTVSQYAVESKDNFPITHWIMMGIHNPGIVNTSDNEFTESFETKEEKTKANLDEIKETLQEYGMTGFLNHCIQKLPITWADGTSEGELRMRQIGEGNRLYQWIAGEKTDIIGLYSQSLYIAILLFMMYSLWKQWKSQEERGMFVFALTVFGGMVFYLLWEAKASYNIPFLPFMYVLATDGTNQFVQHPIPMKRKYIVSLGKLLIFVTILMGISNYWIFAKEEAKWKQFSIYTSNDVLMSWEEQMAMEDKVLEQEFYPNKKFNRLRITCEPLQEGTTTYFVQLWNKNGMIFEKEVTMDMIKENRLIFKFPTQNPGEKYSIRILAKEGEILDTIKWGSHYTSVSDQYKGNCYVDGQKLVSDLFIRVYNEKEGTYMNPILYIFLVLGTVCSEWFILVQVLRLEKKKKGK